MIQILSKDMKSQLDMLIVERGEIVQRKHTKLLWWGIDTIEG